MRVAVSCVGLLFVAACGGGPRGEDLQTGGGTAIDDDGVGDDTGPGGADDDSADDDGILLDVGDTAGPDSGGVGSCHVTDDIDGVGDCDDVAPPDSFDAEVQWAFSPEDGEIFSMTTPLVANLTDDNGDGSVDLCDTPDVVLVATKRFVQPGEPGHVYVIDGQTGLPHSRLPLDVKSTATPAIADLDDDGVPEIVTATHDTYESGGGRLVALRPDGTEKWSSGLFAPQWHGSATAIADVDNDGSPEILYEDMLFDANGQQLLDAGVTQIIAEAPALADLDGDDDMELVFGHVAVHHDGAPYYSTGLIPGFPAVADLDDDPQPEIVVTNETGIHVLEHDGTLKFGDLRPTGVPADGLNWARPVTVHNFDGDPQSEFAMSSRDFYSVYERDGTLVWSAAVLDESGFAAGTAFDFLGDGQAEAMYADEHAMFVFDGNGQALLSTPRRSHTLHEYPVVADIDNDGSAEILVVSEEREPTGPDGTFVIPTIQAIRDREDRWIQARRIWNQDTYHVTNVREDATIPTVEQHHWEHLNTWRTNAQLDASGDVCLPRPAG
jgi:outer membrane protein assembly factor BamB